MVGSEGMVKRIGGGAVLSCAMSIKPRWPDPWNSEGEWEGSRGQTGSLRS